MNIRITKAPLVMFLFIFFTSLFSVSFHAFAHDMPGCEISGTITSVQSGNWSNPATWGGRVPGTADTVAILTHHTVVYDMDTATIAGVNLACDAILQFDPTKNTTLQSTKNIVIKGTLEMHPNTSAVQQTIQFIGINEDTFIGGGENPLDSDIGLWVMGTYGKADLLGTQKTPWLNASGALSAGATTITLSAVPVGWRVGDEVSIA
ncbi:MAG TPA: G8 domain-containing protein, partial [Candidatus Paceibacterota bacterium]|nr:G8 domain-containing protein [Candidatus Paceibacterota bacterium]